MNGSWSRRARESSDHRCMAASLHKTIQVVHDIALPRMPRTFSVGSDASLASLSSCTAWSRELLAITDLAMGPASSCPLQSHRSHSLHNRNSHLEERFCEQCERTTVGQSTLSAPGI